MILKLADKELREPRPRFGDDTAIMSMEYIDRDHTPYNKRPGSVHESRASLEVTRFHGKNVTFLTQEDTTANIGGRSQGRVISMTMTQAEAERIARFILDGK